MTAVSLNELSRKFEPLAAKLNALTADLDDRVLASPTLRLAMLSGEITHVVGFLLRNVADGQRNSERHNLQVLHGLAEQLVTAIGVALDEVQLQLPDLHGHCLARAQLTEAERRWLEFRPYAGNEVPAELSCELEAAHAGPHAGSGQMGNGVQWWLRWTLIASEIVELRNCPAERTNTDPDDLNETDPCLLYVEHPGVHSYDIGPQGL